MVQNFDHFTSSKDREFMCAACNITGESCVFGSYDRLRVLTYSSRKGAWEESPPKDVENLYTVTSLSWRRDGSKIAVVRRVERIDDTHMIYSVCMCVCLCLSVCLSACLSVCQGSLCGAMDVFDCCIRRVMYKNKYELTYVSQSQVSWNPWPNLMDTL